MKRFFVFILAGFTLLASRSPAVCAEDSMRAVATTRLLASIAEEVIGNEVSVDSIAPPARDLHFVSPTPRDVLRVKKADIFIHHGLEAEPWREPLLHAAGRGDFLRGERTINASRNIPLLLVPTELTRLEGDIHAGGNPHYWTDPENAKLVARTIAEDLGTFDPEKAGVYKNNAEAFCSRVDSKMKEWQKRLMPYQGSKVVTYHRSWPYFLKRFGLEIAGEIEAKPGIPPTARHLSLLIQNMRDSGVKVVIKEPFHESRSPDRLAAQTGAVVVELIQFPGARKAVKDYLSVMEYNVTQLENAFKTQKGSSL